MLLELHIKSLAFVGKADMEFGEGLNILIDKTRAGKSIITGSVTMVLGGKASRGGIRSGADHAYIELVLFVIGEEKWKALGKLNVEPTGDGLVIISRKLTPARSISHINDETVTMVKLNQITDLLPDIHGQREYQSLFYKSKHLEILDAYTKAAIQPVRQTTADRYHIHRFPEERLGGSDLDVESRIQEADFFRLEVEGIKASALEEGEEEELTSVCHHYSHSRRIAEYSGAAHEAMEGDRLAKILKEMGQASEHGESLGGIRDQFYDVNPILRDAGGEMSAYLDSMEMNEETFRKTEEHLDPIYNLQVKYGPAMEAMFQKSEQKKKRLGELGDYDAHKKRMEQEPEECRNGLGELCVQLTGTCKKTSRMLVKKIRQGLVDLSFLDVEFDMEFEKLDHFTPSGWGGTQLLVSANLGQPVRPPIDVASGGEFSRVMLATKTVLVDSNDTPTLISDETDAGINRRTTQKILEKLMLIARSHQVICITHLPQIAAMADSHFEVAEPASQGRTIITIHLSDRQVFTEELARLSGDVEIMEAVPKNTGEMRELTDRTKQSGLES